MPKPHYKYFAWLVRWIPIITSILQIRKPRHRKVGDVPKVTQLDGRVGCRPRKLTTALYYGQMDRSLTSGCHRGNSSQSHLLSGDERSV